MLFWDHNYVSNNTYLYMNIFFLRRNEQLSGYYDCSSVKVHMIEYVTLTRQILTFFFYNKVSSSSDKIKLRKFETLRSTLHNACRYGRG